ncbi:phasin family protein [Pseudomaricurvus alkylphenolicus]|jgi:phasin family protein|uniref:phasin family protein n=1 Tax=Pseudomaricurvus alkylphenolicus TaxID=1306991 RepID=UPI0014223570|nr:phasin family protein [Pseudomaricurvus alkylphenolicus]NIB43356.1 phasin family protein [Pseudomaricurvus alkylphenolicus]
MFDQITEQFQRTLKPVSDLATINAQVTEQLLQQQTNLFTGMMNDGVNFAKNVSEQKDMGAILEAQKSYAEGVQEKLVATTKDAYAVMTQAQEKVGEVLKTAFAEAKENAAEVTAKATKAATKAAAAK